MSKKISTAMLAVLSLTSLAALAGGPSSACLSAQDAAAQASAREGEAYTDMLYACTTLDAFSCASAMDNWSNAASAAQAAADWETVAC